MTWVIIVSALLMLLAPVRRYWYVVLPGIAGGYLGLSFACSAVAAGGPAVILLLAPLLGAAMFAGALKEFFGNRSAPNGDGKRNGDGH